MNNDYTDINVVQDKSGSMAELRDETIGGFNTFLADQQKAPGVAKMTLMQFDTTFKLLYSGEDIKKVEPLTHATYAPGGGTALLDAIARTIITTGQRLEAMPEQERPGRVIVVILTDGQENSSVEYGGHDGHKRVMEMIEHQTKTYNWQFLFIGAQQDAIQGGGRIGVAAANSISTANTSKGIRMAYAHTSDNLRAYRAASPDEVQFMEFSAEQRDQQLAEGAVPDALSAKPGHAKDQAKDKSKSKTA